MALKCEPLMCLCVVTALIGFDRFLTRNFLLSLFLAGMLFALAVFAKQQAYTFVCISVVVLGLRCGKAFSTLRFRAFTPLVIFCAGGLTVVAAMLAFNAADGSLHEFILQTFQLPLSLAHAQVVTPSRRVMRMLTYPEFYARPIQFFAVCALAGAFVELLSVRSAAHFTPRAATNLILLLGGVWAYFSSADIYLSYFVMLIPAFAFGFALFLDRIKSTEALRSLSLASFIALAFNAIFIVQPLVKGTVDGMTTSEQAGVAELIKQQAKPGDGIFVWGWAPEYYSLTKLRPATRFTVVTSVVGINGDVHGTSEDSKTASYHENGSWAVLLSDLAHDAPRFFIDAKTLSYGATLRLSDYPDLAKLVSAHYTKILENGPQGIDVYERKPEQGDTWSGGTFSTH
jgi:hypothetical protein